MRLLALALTVTFAACGSQQQQGYRPTPSARETVLITLGAVPMVKFVSAFAEASTNVKASGSASVSTDYGPRPGPKLQSGEILGLAFADAQRKAEILAAAAHVKLGTVDAVVEEFGGVTPLSSRSNNVPLSASVNAQRMQIAISPDAPVMLAVRYHIAGASDPNGLNVIEVVGVASPANARVYEGGRTGRVAVNIDGTGPRLQDAMNALKAYEDAVRSTAHSLGISDAAIEIRDASFMGVNQGAGTGTQFIYSH
jgi:hypothetical protein